MVDLTDYVVLREPINAPNVEITLPVRDLMPRGRAKNVKISELLDGMGVESGTYTPSFIAISNIDSVTDREATWFRIGDIVFVAGTATVDCTTIGQAAFMRALPPILSRFNTGANATGMIFDTGASVTGNIRGFVDGSDHFLEMAWFAATDASRDYTYLCSYEIKVP